MSRSICTLGPCFVASGYGLSCCRGTRLQVYTYWASFLFLFLFLFLFSSYFTRLDISRAFFLTAMTEAEVRAGAVRMRTIYLWRRTILPFSGLPGLVACCVGSRLSLNLLQLPVAVFESFLFKILKTLWRVFYLSIFTFPCFNISNPIWNLKRPSVIAFFPD